MSKNIENPTRLFVSIDQTQNQPRLVTKLINQRTNSIVSNQKVILLRSREDWQQLTADYQDINIDRGMKTFPELNSLFCFLITLLVDEDNTPQNVEILLDKKMLLMKGNNA